ncbi:MAG: hypothetical protein U0521_23985 [Anaerolineae bacterium]
MIEFLMFPGEMGIRIEDGLLITETGNELLAAPPKRSTKSRRSASNRPGRRGCLSTTASHARIANQVMRSQAHGKPPSDFAHPAGDGVRVGTHFGDT